MQSDTMRISAIIPTHNRQDMVAEAIESVLAQTLKPLEIVCVDDASSDGTWEVLRGFENRTQGLVRAFRHEENQGPGATRNTGIAHARGDWVCFLDDDDQLLPQALDILTRAARENPWADVVHGDHWREWNRDPATRRRGELTGLAISGDPLPVLFHQNYVSNQGPLVRKSCLERVGGFRAEYPRAQDYDLWLRLAAAGCKFHYVNEPVAIYRVGHGSLTRDSRTATRFVLHSLERLLDSHPEAAERIGARPARARMLSLRFDEARRLLKSADRAGAAAILEKAWREGWAEPLAWETRLQLLGTGRRNEKAARVLKTAAHRFRDRARADARRYARAHRRARWIVHVVHRLSIGGVSRVLQSLLPRLQDDSSRHSVLCLHDRGELASDLEREGVRVESLGLDRTLRPKDIRALRDWFSRELPDLAHVHIPEAVRPCALALRALPIPYLAHAHGMLDDYWRLQPPLARHFDKRAFRRADAIVAVSKPVREVVARELGLEASAIAWVPNGADFGPRISQSGGADRTGNVTADELRTELGIPAGARVVGIIARPCRAKRLPDFVKAAAIVRRSLPETRFVVVGDGAERHVKEFLGTIEAENAAEYVIWARERWDVAPFLDLFDVGVLCSVREGFPVTILEYLGWGLPVVATDIAAHRELIRPDENGLLVRVKDPQSLADGILRVLRDPELADALSRRAPESIKEFTWERCASEMNRAYDALAEKRSAKRA